MSTIAEILMAKGRQEAESRRARAGAWMPLVQHLATLPGQVMADRAAEGAARASAYDRKQQRDVRAQQLDKGKQELAAGERAKTLAEATAAQKKQMNELLATPGIIGKDNRFDVTAAQRVATEKGYTDILDDVLDFGKDWNEGVDKGLLTQEQIAAAKRSNQPDPPKTREIKIRNADGSETIKVIADAPGFEATSAAEVKPDTRALNLQLKDALNKGPAGRAEANIIRQAIREAAAEGRDPTDTNVPAGADGVTPPLDPSSQDLMSQAGLTYNGFLALTGRMSQLPRDRETRNRASAEVQAWARKRGMDVATLASQYKAYNETLENNIQRYNRTQLAEGEIAADVENLIGSVKTSGLGDVRAINAAKQWLKGELNDPNAAEYAFFLNQLVNDIALYNSASQGRATLQSDVEDAKSVVQRGIAAGSLAGMQKAITASVEKMGTVLEGSVNRSRKNVWDLFGVGDKYKPKPTAGARGATDQPPPSGIKIISVEEVP